MPSHQLESSQRLPIPGARAMGKADPAERIEVSLLVRRRSGGKLGEIVDKLASGAPSPGHLSREQFAERFSTADADIAAVRTFAENRGLTVVVADAARRTVVLAGTVAQCNRVFGVDLERYETADGAYRGRTGAVVLSSTASSKPSLASTIV